MEGHRVLKKLQCSGRQRCKHTRKFERKFEIIKNCVKRNPFIWEKIFNQHRKVKQKEFALIKPIKAEEFFCLMI